MSTPPPRRRKISSVVTVRRAQSERRYLSPWQTQASHGRYWQPLLYPGQGVPPPPPSGFPPLLAQQSGWARMERIEHRIDHHHHAPRTALIPPALPRSHHPHMIGKSQLVLSGDLWGSIRTRPRVPYMSPAQLPPLALGSPPPLMAAPPMILPPGNLQEKLAQDRLTAFLSGDTGTYRPRSILSCPESPLYESLVSTFSTLDDELNFPDTDGDHEYQQIPLLQTLGRKPPNNQDSAKDPSTPSSSRHQPDNTHPEIQSDYQTVNDVKLTTLDVRPEKNASREKDLDMPAETQVCNCQSGRTSDPGSGVPSPVSKKMDSSSQTVSPASEFHRSTVYINDDGGSSLSDTPSSLSDSDTYQDIDRPPTVIYLPSSSKEPTGRSSSANKSNENGFNSTEAKRTPSFSSKDIRVVSPRLKPSVSSAASAANPKSSHSPKSVNHSESIRIQKKSLTKTPEATYLPLTIELPETKENPRKSDQSSKRNQEMSPPAPHIITTLDPPIKNNKNFPDWASESSDIPPLVVNFDSESEDDLVMETDFSSTTLDNNSTSIYVTEGDTTSLYSSIAELYSVLPGDPDSLVYVYRAVPHQPNNDVQVRRHPSTVGYRIPAYILNRSDDCSSCSSCGSEASWSDTVSFVEPTYRPTNLSVGSRGHLKIDYSWSWNSLDDFVRTTSPRGGSSEERLGSPGRSYYSNQSPQGRPKEERKISFRSPHPLKEERKISARGPHPLPGASPPSNSNIGVSLSPWEKYSDPVAG